MMHSKQSMYALTHGRRVRDQRRWYVVQTHVHKETTAKVHLERQGYRVFLPQFLKSERRMRRVREVLAPLFPRYMFVSLDLEVQGWRSIRSTIGVAALVMEAERPRPVPRGLVEELLERAGDDHAINVRETGFRPGEQVRFVDGPFADRIGQLLEMRDAERALVLLNLLGSERPVMVTTHQLTRVRFAS
jgi:transcriptional antiterminator RfaH